MSVSGTLKKKAESSKRKRRKEPFRAFWKTRSSLGVAITRRTTFSRICATISAINSQNTAPLARCPPAPQKEEPQEASLSLPRSHPYRPGSKGSQEESRKKLLSLSRGQPQGSVFPGKSWKCDRDPLPSSEAGTMYIQMTFTLKKKVILMLG